MNCVSFLVNFGVNLWALDNDFHTAKDLAAMNQRAEILKYLDEVIARQSALNKKLVMKLKEKSIKDAEKRVKAYNKLQKKAVKKAEKEEKQLEKQRRRMTELEIVPGSIRKDSPRFSEIVSTCKSSVGTKKGLGAVSKRVLQKKQDFKVGEAEGEGRRSVRSLTGLRRDSEVLYVPKYCSSQSTVMPGRRPLKDLFDTQSHLSHAASEPDFAKTIDSGLGDELTLNDPPSIFERPGFGSVSFRTGLAGTLAALPSDTDSRRAESAAEDSIGSAGSLACDDDLDVDSQPVIIFLAAHGLAEYVPVFARERIDLDALMLVGEEDMKAMGLPLGPRRKLARAIELRKSALENPGEMVDSFL
ncbi:USH1G [Cordylochernes scorpioides]|uniref:USH1G n=1 Tax=Cordylochernes scorpioides TaxID=51811 RepID=A0ABY6KSA8_9ARAC|nr:USH1G [Cordylochernes scorpioides]